MVAPEQFLLRKSSAGIFSLMLLLNKIFRAVVLEEFSLIAVQVYVAGFALEFLEARDAGSLGAEHKQSLMYELELAAAVFAMKLWGCDGSDSLFVCYGDNDSVRYSLIRAVASSEVALAFMACHLEWEANASCAT